MEQSGDILGLRLSGGGLTPDSVKASEVAFLIAEFERLLLSTLKAQNPEIDIRDNVILNFHQVRNESLGVFLKESAQFKLAYQIKTALFILVAQLSAGKLNDINEDTLKSLRNLQKFSKTYDAKAEIRINDQKYLEFDKDTNFAIKANTYSGPTILLAELLDSGGENPNLHLKLPNDKVIIVRTDKETAKHLGGRLYEAVALDGVATWDIETNEVVKFELRSDTGYRAGRAYEAIERLRDLTNGYWDQFGSDDEINEALLRD